MEELKRFLEENAGNLVVINMFDREDKSVNVDYVLANMDKVWCEKNNVGKDSAIFVLSGEYEGIYCVEKGARF